MEAFQSLSKMGNAPACCLLWFRSDSSSQKTALSFTLRRSTTEAFALLLRASLRYKLLGGLAVRRACYGVLRFIMESGAKGCEVIVSGKLRAQRAKSMKFKDGYMISSGHPVNEYIDSAVRHVLLRQGVLGIKVKIMLDWDPKGKQGPTTPLPDLVTIHSPKEDEETFKVKPETTDIEIPCLVFHSLLRPAFEIFTQYDELWGVMLFFTSPLGFLVARFSFSDEDASQSHAQRDCVDQHWRCELEAVGSGEKGRRIRELTSVVQKRFKFPENSVELYAEKVNNRGICAIAQAESSLQASRRACYGVLRFIMESGAKGCEVIVSGKLRAQRAKSMKFKDGYMISSGHPVNEYIDSAVRHVLLRQVRNPFVFSGLPVLIVISDQVSGC
ncbi:Small ribosomal subunit protein uS3 [Theobroma cacao]|nr:Small ribosomal subunit protein uS3 [Theobroma cacao]